jgi:hypothetical protein
LPLEVEPRDVTEFGGPQEVYPMGDIDGDGFADIQLTLSRVVPGYDGDEPIFLNDYSLDLQPFIKYGGPLTGAIH